MISTPIKRCFHMYQFFFTIKGLFIIKDSTFLKIKIFIMLLVIWFQENNMTHLCLKKYNNFCFNE